MNRRLFLRGLVAAPAVVAIDSLMPVRGIIMDAGLQRFIVTAREILEAQKALNVNYAAVAQYMPDVLYGEGIFRGLMLQGIERIALQAEPILIVATETAQLGELLRYGADQKPSKVRLLG